MSKNPKCERCRENYSKQIHHITPLKRGGEAYKFSNMMAVCEGCHKEIHKEREQDARLKPMIRG